MTKALLALPLLLAAAPLSAPEQYQIDGSHTYVGFEVRHMMVSNVRGQFENVQGDIVYDAADVANSSAEVRIETCSIDTNNDRRDNHLRSDDFFNCEQYPYITFRSTSVHAADDGFVMEGDLTIRDVTRRVSIPFELTGPADAGNGRKVIGAEGELVIDRHDYNVRWNRTTEAGGLVVGPEVKVELKVAARTAGA